MMARPYQAEHNRDQKDQHERRNPQPHAVPDSIDVRHDGSSRPFSVLACPRARRRASLITRRRFAHLLSGDQAGLYGERGGAINNGNRLIRATAAFGPGNILRVALVLHNSRAVKGNVARSASHANTAGRQKRASEQQIRAQPSASARTPRWTLGELSSAHAFPPTQTPALTEEPMTTCAVCGSHAISITCSNLREFRCRTCGAGWLEIDQPDPSPRPAERLMAQLARRVAAGIGDIRKATTGFVFARRAEDCTLSSLPEYEDTETLARNGAVVHNRPPCGEATTGTTHLTR